MSIHLPEVQANPRCPDISTSTKAHQAALQRAKDLAQAMLLGGLSGASSLCSKELDKLKLIILTNHSEGINEEDFSPTLIPITRSDFKNLIIAESFEKGVSELQKKQIRQQRFELNSYFFNWSFKNKKINFEQDIEIVLNPKYSQNFRCGYTTTTLKDFLIFKECLPANK